MPEIMLSEAVSAANYESWPELFAALQFHLSALDIVRLDTCSKALHAFLIELLRAGDRHFARDLLVSTVQRAASCSKSSTCTPWQMRQHSKTVAWLVRTAGIDVIMIRADGAKYLSVANTPLAVCKQLVASGAEIDYEQLVSAARNHVEGIENWVVAYKLVGKPTGLPRLVEAVCCRGWQYIQAPMVAELPSMGLADLLSIAINTQGRSSTTNSTAVDEAATDTLSTLLGCMRRSAAARQLPAVVLLQLLQSQVHVLSSRKIDARCTYSCMADFSCLLNSAADASSISSAAVEELLLTAVQQRLDTPNLQYLLTLQAVRQLDAAGIARVLQAELDVATAHGPGKLRDSVVTRLCKLHTAGEMSPEDCAGLCRALIGFMGRAAAPAGRSQWHAEIYSVLRGLMSKLRVLSGMQGMSAAAVLHLLQLTVKASISRKLQDSGPYSVLKLLCSLPAAALVNGPDMSELLQKAQGLGPEVCDVLRQVSAA